MVLCFQTKLPLTIECAAAVRNCSGLCCAIFCIIFNNNSKKPSNRLHIFTNLTEISKKYHDLCKGTERKKNKDDLFMVKIYWYHGFFKKNVTQERRSYCEGCYCALSHSCVPKFSAEKPLNTLVAEV